MPRRRKNADYLRFVADEIGQVDPQPGEDEELEARLPALQHGERLAEAAGEATQLLRGDGGALDRIAQASAALAKVAGIDPALDELAAAPRRPCPRSPTTCRRTPARTATASSTIPRRSTRCSRGSSALSGLKKKYGPRLEDVLARARATRSRRSRRTMRARRR